MSVRYVNNIFDYIFPDSPRPISHAKSTSQPLLQKQAAPTSTDASCDDQSAGDVRQLDISEHNGVTTRDSSTDNSGP